MASLEVRGVMVELRCEGKEKEEHLGIGNSTCKRPVAEGNKVNTGEVPGRLEQGELREKGKS